MLNSSHTHCGPELRLYRDTLHHIPEPYMVKMRAYVDWLDERVVDLIGEALDGEEALRLARINKPDLMIMDINMPEVDGIEATKLIRSEEITVLNNEIPIIAMTAHAMKEDMEQCLAVGMNGYISKPVSQKRIAEAIEKILG